MKINKKFDPSFTTCPICKKDDERPSVYIPFAEDFEKPTRRAIQVHIDCLNLVCYQTSKTLCVAQNLAGCERDLTTVYVPGVEQQRLV